jgi:hypothetical protein
MERSERGGASEKVAHSECALSDGLLLRHSNTHAVTVFPDVWPPLATSPAPNTSPAGPTVVATVPNTS